MVFSQPWMNFLKLERDKREKVTFYEIQEAFAEYEQQKGAENGYVIKNGSKRRLVAWKQYKRWEHFWESRVNLKTGEFPETTPFHQYKKYIKKHQAEKNSDPSNWVNLGTDFTTGGYAGIGRINCIEFHPDNDTVFWVGAPSGGLWKTTDGGENWTVQTDNNPVLGVSDIAIPSDYATTKTIYIATGDRDVGDNYSAGVLKSTDGGDTWTESLPLEVANRDLVNHLLIHPQDDQTLYAATTNGVIKTTDAGNNWKKIAPVALKDVEFKPGNPAVMYGSTYSEPTKIYKSADAGENWSEVLSVTGNRTELSVSPDSAHFVYAIVSNTSNGLEGIYKSTNSGETFDKIYDDKNMLGWSVHGTDEGGQGFYDLTVAADPNHADAVYAGGVNTWRSTDGGENWEIVNHWTGDNNVPTVHADKHAMEFQNGSSILFEGNDGGIYKTTDAGEYWEDLTNGMVISQIYKISTSQTEPELVINGLQDNGTKLYDQGDWYDKVGGDGMDCMIDYNDADIQYTTGPNGKLYRTKDRWVNGSQITPSGATPGAWVTPIVMHPSAPRTIYAGYTELWKSNNRGDDWFKISQVDSYYKIRAVSISESNPDYIYMADLGDIWRTTDGGQNWDNVSEGLPNTVAISNIEVDFSNPDVAWVTMKGYNNNTMFKTTDGGQNWENISDGLPSVPVNDVVQDNSNSNQNILYAGTDVGVYKKEGDTDWSVFSNNLPNVIANDLEIYYGDMDGDNILRAATYGRGLWEAPISNDQFVENPKNMEATPRINNIQINWNLNANNDTVLLAGSKEDIFETPSSAVDYNEVDTLPDGKEVLFYGVSEEMSHNSLAPNTKYAYKLWSYDGQSFSTGVQITAQTLCDTPSTQVSNIQFTDIQKKSVEISWDRGNGDGVLVLAKKKVSIYKNPVCGKDYTANQNFGQGDNLGSTHYVVYNGDGTSATIEGLEEMTEYNFAFYEYNASDHCYHIPPALATTETSLASDVSDRSANHNLKIYPNPANDHIVLSMQENRSPLTVEIVDMAGKVAFHGQMTEAQKEIDIHTWENGTYIVKFIQDDQTLKQKLIVE